MNFDGKFEELRKKVEDRIKDVTTISEPQELYEPYNYFMAEGGKRIRPVLSMIACGAVGGDPDEALDCGVAIEIMHNFTLVHDDIMDRSDMRRGRATVHKKWNEAIAILTGDAMIGFAYKLLPSCKRYYEITKAFSEGLVDVCEGQVYDMQFNTRRDVSMEEYLLMIEKKTSRLLETSALIGALAGDASHEQLDALKSYAKYLGLAFQIQDDLLDIIADEKKLGKKVGLDIQEGKKTFLIIQAMKVASKPEHTELLKLYYESNGLDASYVEKFKAMFEELGVLEYAQGEASKYFELSKQSISILPDNDYKEMLFGLVDKLTHRSY